MPIQNPSTLADLMAAMGDQALFERLHRTPFGDLLKGEQGHDLPADGRFHVPIRVDARTSLVTGPASRREQSARPVGARPAPARADSAQD